VQYSALLCIAVKYITLKRKEVRGKTVSCGESEKECSSRDVGKRGRVGVLFGEKKRKRSDG
jgi:hypothetical protein